MNKFLSFIEDFRNEDPMLIESILKSYNLLHTLIESSTASNKLNNMKSKDVFIKLLSKTIKDILLDYYEYDYTFLVNNYEKNKYLNNFINILIIISINKLKDDGDIFDEYKEMLKQYNEVVTKINNIDDNQLDMYVETKEYKEQTLHSIRNTFIESLKTLIEEYSDDIELNTTKSLSIELYDPLEQYEHNGMILDRGDYEDDFDELIYEYGYPGGDTESIMDSFLHTLANDSELNISINAKNIESTSELNTFIYDWADTLTLNAINEINKNFVIKNIEDAESYIDCGNGLTWYNLNCNASQIDGKLMNHCGNTYGPDKHPDDELWSLREYTDEYDDDGNKIFIPHITVVINPTIKNGLRVIKQIKGNGPGTGNTKPSKKYHECIIKLLLGKLNNSDKYIIDGFYMHPFHGYQSNFMLSDLDEEVSDKLKSIRPELFNKIE